MSTKSTKSTKSTEVVVSLTDRLRQVEEQAKGALAQRTRVEPEPGGTAPDPSTQPRIEHSLRSARIFLRNHDRGFAAVTLTHPVRIVGPRAATD